MKDQLKHLIQDNQKLLQQAAALILQLSDERFRQAVEPPQVDSPGAHLRHILDHYDCFFRGLNCGKIDYDARRRESRIQEDRCAAMERIGQTQNALLSLLEMSLPDQIQTKVDCGTRALWSESSILRELQFLANHTFHHHAQLRLMLPEIQETLDAAFGVAPGTLKFRESHAISYQRVTGA